MLTILDHWYACALFSHLQGYERKWCWYKVIVMVLKLCLCLPVMFLYNHPLYQSLVTLAVLAVYCFLSFAASPFISRQADIMDSSGRVTTLLTVIFGLIATRACITRFIV